MSHLSFARIMYGSTQQNSSPVAMPVSNSTLHLKDAAPSSLALAASHATVESLLHKALLAFSRYM